MSEREAALLLQDIIESGKKILTYTTGLSYDDFIADNKTIDAVIRNFQIMGEATQRLPVHFKNQYAGIPWRRIRGFRNRIVHVYFGIDYFIVWQIITTSLPDIIGELEQIIE